MPDLLRGVLAKMTLVAVAVAACSMPSPSVTPILSASPSPTAGFSLPTLSEWNGNCAGIGLDGELMGDPNDPRVAWLRDAEPGGWWPEIVFPPGFTARFAPDLEILDAEGNVAIREGDHVKSGCLLDDRVLLIDPDALDLADR